MKINEPKRSILIAISLPVLVGVAILLIYMTAIEIARGKTVHI